MFLEGPQEAGGEEVAVKKDAIENSFTCSGGKQLSLLLSDAASATEQKRFRMRSPTTLSSTPPESVDDSEYVLVNEFANDLHVCGLVYYRTDPAFVRR